MANMNSSSLVFTKLLPISIRKDISVGQRDLGGGDACMTRQNVEQKEVIRITVVHPSSSCGAMNPQKEISLRLTNDENPSFYYFLRICESEFPELKSRQGLLVDFYGFPQQLVTLLDKCDPNSEESVTEIGPKFLLVLKVGAYSVLDIVESNPFKYLCHLSLLINPGSDSDVKKYLCDVTTSIKKDFQLLQEKYNHLVSSMNSEVGRSKALLEAKTQELNQLQNEIHNQASTLASKHFNEMTQEKEKILKLQSELSSKFDQEKSDIDKRHGQMMITLEDRITTLEAENRELLQYKYKNESVLHDTKTKLKSYEDDLKIMQQELTLTRKQNGKLDNDYHEKQRAVNSLQNKLTTVEADLREKHSVVQRQQDYIGQLTEQKKFLDDHCSKLTKDVDKLKSVNKNVSTELIKANEIIRKLQDDIRNMHTKSKLQHQITSEQERAIQDRDKQVHNLESDAAVTKTNLATKESEIEHLHVQLQESEKKIEEYEKNAKSNENMIAWLNKQLNEFQGLSNLKKFRENLSQNQNIRQEDENGNEGDRNSQSDLQRQLQQIRTGSANQVGGARKSTFFTRLQSVGNNQNNNSYQSTVPATTPSWMHIYQSTANSTPLEDDLSARLELVPASLGNNPNGVNGKSRLETISEKSIPVKPPAVSNVKNASISNTNSRPPTWAKGRGKVTLDGPVSTGKPIFRSRNTN